MPWKRSIEIGRWIFLGLLAVAVIAFFRWEGLADIDQNVRKHIVVGAPRSEVENYFNQRRYEHLYDERTNSVNAFVSHIRGTLPPFMDSTAVIATQLDASGAVRSIQVEVQNTGL